MKSVKRFLLIFLLIILIVTSTGCRCVPSSEAWYLYSYTKSITFIGGVEKELGFSSASVIYPFANADFSHASISFFEDGKVSFCTWDGDELDGTYTYEHIGNYTRAYVTFSNGESATVDIMSDMKNNSKLLIKFREVTYSFTDSKIDGAADLDGIIKTVKEGDARELHPATVINTDGSYSVVFSEFVSYPITETTAVYAIKIASDGTYSVLDEILEGDALSTYNNKADYIILYYVEK